MKLDETGRVNGIRKSGTKDVCAHQRIVEDHYNEQGKKTGHVVCRECGTVIRDPVKA